MCRTAVAHVLCASILVAVVAHAGPPAASAPKRDFAGIGGSPPALIDAYPIANMVRVVFDRAVTASSATNLFNYSLASLGTVNAASMDGTSAVYLTIANDLPRSALETVTVNGVISASSGLPMTSPQSRTFVNGVLTAAEVQAADADALAGTPCQDRSRFAGVGGTPGVRLTVGATVTAKFATDVNVGDPPDGGVRGGLRVTGVAPSVSPGIFVEVAGAIVETDGETRLDGPVFVWNTATASPVKPRRTLVPQLLDASCDALGIFNEAEDVEGMSIQLNGMIVVSSDPPNRQFWIADTLAAPTESVRVSDPGGVLSSIPLTGDRISVTGVVRGTTGGGVEVSKVEDIQSIAIDQFTCEANEDSTFAAGDWKRHMVWWKDWSHDATWQLVDAGGNSGPFMRGAFAYSQYGSLATLELVMSRASYDPSSWNGMCEFAFAADFRYANQWDGFRPTDPPTNVHYAPCIFQDGDTFIGPAQGPALTPDWQHYAWNGLHAVDFVNPFNSQHPDLGPTGKPIELGFFTAASPSSSGGFYPTAYIDMDNVAITACPCQLPDHCVKPISPITAWWPLDGTGTPVQEVVGSHNGIPSEGVTPVADGEVAGGLHFGHTSTGGAAFVEVPHAADLDMQNNRPFTVETWFRSSNQESELRALVEKLSGPSSHPLGYQLALYQKRIGFYWYEALAPYNWWWTPQLPTILDGQWHHIVATLRWYSNQQRTGLSLFVDGVPYITGAMRPLGTISPANSSPLWFGKGRYVPQALEGDLDEVSIYPRSLSDNEILLSYRAGPHGTCKEFCRLPAFRSYCAQAETLTVQLEICNHSDFTQTYSWAAQGNAADPVRCDADGTGAQFTPGAGQLTLASGQCASVPILVRPPAGVSGHSMCYSVTVDNTLTGWTSSASGVIKGLLPNAGSPMSLLCATAAPIGPDVFLVGAPHPRLPFDIANNGADAVLARYRVHAMLSSLVDTDPNVTLNGLPPGESVVDSVLVPAHSTYRVWVEPQFFSNIPFAPTELVLSLDRTGVGPFVPLQSLLLHPSYAASPNPTTGCTSPPAGLLAWCSFDQVISGATPELRSGLPCTVAGGPAVTTGQVAGALHLATAAQYVSVAGAAPTDVGTGDFSIAAWVRWASAVSGRRTIVEKGAGSPLAHGYSLYLAASHLGLELADSAGATTFEAPAAVVADGQWHLVAASVARGDSTGGVLRLDGNALLRFDPRVRAASLTNVGALRIGQNDTLSSTAFNGDVDEVQLFGSALDSLAVAAIVTAGPAGECKPSTTGPVTAVTAPELSESLLLYPNPTWGRDGWIRFVVPRAQSFQLRLYDVAGRMVRSLVDGRFEAGAHAVRWEPARVPPGVYFAHARFGGSGHHQVRTVVVLR